MFHNCIFGVVVIYQIGLGNSGAYSVVISVIVGEFPVYSPAELFAFVIEKSVIFHGDVPYHEFYLLAQFAQTSQAKQLFLESAAKAIILMMKATKKPITNVSPIISRVAINKSSIVIALI